MEESYWGSKSKYELGRIAYRQFHQSVEPGKQAVPSFVVPKDPPGSFDRNEWERGWKDEETGVPICAECNGDTTRYRLTGEDVEILLCVRVHEPGHLTKEQIAEKDELEIRRIVTMRFA